MGPLSQRKWPPEKSGAVQNGYKDEPEESSNCQSIEFRGARRLRNSGCEQIDSRSADSGDNARRERATFRVTLVGQLGSEVRRQQEFSEHIEAWWKRH